MSNPRLRVLTPDSVPEYSSAAATEASWTADAGHRPPVARVSDLVAELPAGASQLLPARAAQLLPVRAVERQLRETLAKEGLEQIPTDGLFDPHVHEALLSQPSDAEEGTVLDVVQKGYKLGDRVLRREQGRLEEIEERVRAVVREYPTRSLLPCIHANLHAELGREGEARRAFEELAANDFSALPWDHEWLVGLSLLSEVAVFLEDGQSAAVIYALLLPFASRAVSTWAEVCLGTVPRYLGLLAATMSRPDEAERWFETALDTDARMGARPWLAHTQHDFARLLWARDRSGDRERAGIVVTQTERVNRAVISHRQRVNLAQRRVVQAKRFAIR